MGLFMEEETIPMLLICSAAVIFFSLFFVFILWKKHGINLAWFIFHIVFSTIFLLLFVNSLDKIMVLI
ncbi:OSMotic avoidance abnormal family member (osm-9) [Desulforamulus ruminis DSM 2154]|uniref:OSMotic avoidance abnormal family member (Osm-9) n=1 Tax=Desulforamulus ruminis (strain ATCC 23193 / DSM 2154 / NCIMB 8452 / DL) TaxID=696281 RepID=F6DV04_DESRL|nr:OSMotic avoidance abnormal family member (osm-9) [Desulforamulus ruminis DSM 2154]